MFGAVIAELWQVETGEKVFPGAEEDRSNGEVHLVDEAGLKVLADGGDAAAKANVLTFGSAGGALKSSVDAIGDEVEGGAAAHGDGFARVMGEHEDRSVVGRVVAPPTFPGIVGPGTADRAEHVATQNPRSDFVEATSGEVVVGACRAAILSKHLLKRAGGEGPFVQGHAANAKRVVEVLARTSAKAVEGYGEALDAEFGHGW